MAPGELFLGIAARLIIRRGDYNLVGQGGEFINGGLEPGGASTSESWWRRWRKEKASSVVIEDPLQPDVTWEQREEDVEAERRWKEQRAVSSPGFSFSAAGLLFPYHLGVAQFLIENGYIKVSPSLQLSPLFLEFH